jgi:hypothetical protein
VTRLDRPHGGVGKAVRTMTKQLDGKAPMFVIECIANLTALSAVLVGDELGPDSMYRFLDDVAHLAREAAEANMQSEAPANEA